MKNHLPQNKKVLIVEDDLPTVDAVAFKLNRRGIQVSTALNGEEAIEKLKKEDYDLILVDILLPKKSGFEVIEEIKKKGYSKKAPIIVFSNLYEEGNIQKAMKLGATDYVVKVNVDVNEMVEHIIKKLSNNK